MSDSTRPVDQMADVPGEDRHAGHHIVGGQERVDHVLHARQLWRQGVDGDCRLHQADQVGGAQRGAQSADGPVDLLGEALAQLGFMSLPSPLARRLLHAPTLLYRWHLGWLLGERFLCLTHVGRRSGQRYHTLLEVIGGSGDELVVLAGRGPSADWVRNIRTLPALDVAVGRRRFAPAHRELGEHEAEVVLACYERRHRRLAPLVRAVLCRLAGWRYDGSPAARRRLVRELPVVAFRPADGARRDHPGAR
jgi:deazaflavin-dependent oxidoreductase (nitroreductase family)